MGAVPGRPETEPGQWALSPVRAVGAVPGRPETDVAGTADQTAVNAGSNPIRDDPA